jgi:hypothetical protein
MEIQDIKDIAWNLKSIEQLVLDPDEKRLIIALIRSSYGMGSQFDDFIPGKGARLATHP